MIITGKYPNLRMRRSRKEEWSRRLVRENSLSGSDFVLPIFVTDGKNRKVEIKSMKGVYRYSVDNLSSIIDRAINVYGTINNTRQIINTISINAFH